ncbi:MAG TPA: PAS domain S-box protein, partial [Segetibacter sp.]
SVVKLINYTLLGIVIISLLLLFFLTLEVWKGIKARRAVESNLKESIERFNFVSKATADAVWDCDLKNDTLLWGDNFETLFGHNPENKKVSISYRDNLLHPQDKDKVIKGIQRVIDSDENMWKEEYRFLRSDGTYAHIIDRAFLIRDKSGEACRIIGSMRDISERKKAEEKEKNLLNHIQLILESTSEGLYGIDKKGNCTFINKAGARLLGYDTFYCIGKNMHELIHYKKRNGEAYPASECLIAKSLADSQSCQVESEVFWRADGSSFYVQYSSNPIVVDNQPTSAVITFSDITERKKAEAKLIESERNLNAILFSSQEALYLLDTDLKLVLMNSESELIMKKLVNKVCKPGDDLLSFFEGAAKDTLLDVYSKVLKGQHIEAEREVKENGETLYYCATYFPVKDENGVIRNICCSSKNITQKKITEEIIEAADAEKEEFQNRFQAILDNSPQAISIKDLEARFIFTNKMFLEAFGFDRDYIIGRKSKDIFNYSGAVVTVDEADKEVLKENKIKEWEEKLTFKDGTEREMQLTKFPLYDSKQELFGIGTIWKDITEIKKYQYDLIQAREKAENAERLQEQFLANMSHELRTPMNGIIGMANVLSNTPLLPKQKDYLKVITRSSDTLLNLINDILDLSKIKAGMLKIENVDFDFNETVAGTTMLFKERTLAKGIRLIVQTEPFIPRWLTGDPHRLTQILNNLLSNAIKFTEKGCVKLEASLLNQEEDVANIEFIVTDTGIGIEQKSLEGIFNSFEQASNDIARKYGGTGLGLPITKRLVEMQGGQITVTSDPGSGSVFTFTLPYQIPKNNPVPVSNGFYKKTSSSEKKDYTGKHILIAEDNEINQDVLAATLKQYNLTYTIANNGKEAIEQIESGKHFDLIFMDLRMPVMNGFQSTAYIREKLHSQIPIVILTASVLRNERERCLSIGASDYMVKPFKQADLNDCLQKYLQSNAADAYEESNDITIETAAENTSLKYNICNLMQLEDKVSIKNVFHLFKNKIPQQLAELKEIILSENRQEFLEKTHKLKGSLSIIQMPEMYNLVISAEYIANSNGNLANTLSIFEKAFEIYTQLVPEITRDIEQQMQLN